MAAAARTRTFSCERLKPFITDKCPFVNLPETGRARWGEILDAEKSVTSARSTLANRRAWITSVPPTIQ